MARTMSKYEQLIAGVEGHLREAAESPFATGNVLGVGWTMSLDKIAETLEQMSTTGPAAIVFFGAGETNGGRGGQLDVDPGVCIALATRGRDPRATSLGDEVSLGLADLVEWCQGLHSKPGIEGVPNPLRFVSTGPLILPWRPTTIAIVIMRFTTELIWTETQE